MNVEVNFRLRWIREHEGNVWILRIIKMWFKLRLSFFSLTHCSFIGIIKRWENFYRRRQLSSIVNFITLADIAPRDRLTSRLDRVVVSWGYDPKGRWPAISPIHSPSRSFLQTKFKGGEIVPSLGILVRDSWSWQGWRERETMEEETVYIMG